MTFTTHDRRPWFLEWRHADVVAAHLARPSSWGSAKLLCWVLMPDHWHGLLELGDEALDRVVGRAKASATFAWHVQASEPGPLWARGFHDHALRREEDVLRVARYIVANPLRASLANSVGQYPYWDAIWL
nr:transposase [Pseudoxanthomonas winnipegensis]